MKKKWTTQERNELAIEAYLGSKSAQAELLYSMEGYVIEYSNKYSKATGVSREDVRSEARLAVVECIAKFNVNHEKANFGELCRLYMQGRLERYCMQNSGPATVPRSRVQRAAHNKLKSFLSEKELEGLTDGEALAAASKHFRLSESDLSFILNAGMRQSIGEDEEFEYQVACKSDPLDGIHDSHVSEIVEKLLSDLDETDRRFVEMYVMCHEEDRQSLETIAEILGVTRYTLKRRWDAVILPQLREKLSDLGLSLSDLF